MSSKGECELACHASPPPTPPPPPPPPVGPGERVAVSVHVTMAYPYDCSTRCEKRPF
jgi:hypothetical protein|eukprot:COSAG06_NODE_8282_length_2217_cov_1.565628_4_plen_57_part_00